MTLSPGDDRAEPADDQMAANLLLGSSDAVKAAVSFLLAGALLVVAFIATKSSDGIIGEVVSTTASIASGPLLAFAMISLMRVRYSLNVADTIPSSPATEQLNAFRR